jgi:hypothetical protein
MRLFSRILIGIIACHIGYASGLHAQSAVSDSAVRAAQAAAGPVLVLNVTQRSSDTLLVQLEAAGTLFDAMLYEPWWPGRGAARLSRDQAGRAVARAAWLGYRPTSGKIAVVVVNVRSSDRGVDPTRIQLVYNVTALERASG